MGLSHPRDAELQLSAGPFWCYPAIIQLIPAWLTCLFPRLAGGSAGSVTARAGPSELYQTWWLPWELLFQPRYQQHILQTKALPHKCPTARSSGPQVGSALVSCPGVQGVCPRELQPPAPVPQQQSLSTPPPPNRWTRDWGNLPAPTPELAPAKH